MFPLYLRFTCFTSSVSAGVSVRFKLRHTKKICLFMERFSSSRFVCLAFILLIICEDLPVFVGVESIEQIVTAVLPWRVSKLEERVEKPNLCLHSRRLKKT